MIICHAQVAVADGLEWRVDPNVGVGPLKLQEVPSADLMTALGVRGRPDFFSKRGVRLTRLRDQSLELIEVFSPFAGATPEEIKIGDSRKKLQETYEDLFAIKDKGGEILIQRDRGIGFRLKDDAITHIGVFRWRHFGLRTETLAIATKDFEIQPGTGLRTPKGNLIFGVTHTENFTGILGPPSSIETTSTLGFGGKIYGYLRRGIFLATAPESSELSNIVLAKPFAGKTTQGIGLGASIEDVFKAYGPHRLDYISLRLEEEGIEFRFDQDRVMVINVFSNL